MSSDNHGASAPGAGHHEEEHEEHVNHEAWVIPYADMLTLLMALFLMLWATSSVDQQKFAALADSLRDAFGNGTGESPPSLVVGGAGVLDGQVTGVENGDFDSSPDDVDTMTPQQALDKEKQRAEDELRETAVLDGVQKRITEKARSEGVAESIEFRRDSRGLVVTIVADPVLFEVGAADLQPRGKSILGVVTEALKGVPNDVTVEGHTDNSPINTPRFPSNWELSSARGTSVLRYMTETLGFDPNRIASTGYGETRPITGNDTAAGKAENRRVEVVVLENKSR